MHFCQVLVITTVFLFSLVYAEQDSWKGEEYAKNSDCFNKLIGYGSEIDQRCQEVEIEETSGFS
jgi:hypothetical protein